jgi:UDP-glucose 4-epimerase
MRSTALVTGGAGFIGSHLVELLVKKKLKVIVIDNLSNGNIKNINHLIKKNKITFIKKNIIDKNINLKKFKIDYVFHLAALGSIVPSIDNPIKYIENNFNGTINILEKIRKIKVKKIIYAASSSCYGIAKTPTKENHIINPKYPYAFSKWVAEEAIKHWAKLFKFSYISIRIFNAYGPRFQTKGAYGSVMGVFLKQKLEKKPLTVVGNGKQKRDFVHAEDVANAFYLAAISKVKNETFNLGSNLPIEVNRMVELLKPSKIEKIPYRPGEPFITHANINKIKKLLKWHPKVKFDNGFKNLIANINDWKNAPLWNKKNIKTATKNWFKYLK